jgi:beta-lactamase class A
MIASVNRRLALALAIAVALTTAIAAGEAPDVAAKGKKQKGGDWRERVANAAAFARSRAGSVSFAVVDERRKLHGFGANAQYSSASLVKAMLLVAFLRKGDVRNRALHPSERGLLGPMIRVSDNEAANTINARVGSGGLARLARRAQMKRFIPNEVWGGSQVTARDQAQFFSRLRRLLPDRHRSYALGLLRNIAPGQRWGIPKGNPNRWRVHFKGGWYQGGDGWRVHQAGLLRRGPRELSVAVLTQGGSGLGYGAATIRGVTQRLLRGYNRYDGPGNGKKER